MSREQHQTTVEAADSVNENHPDDDFTHEIWKEYQELVAALAKEVRELHTNAHSAADAHEAHVEKAKKHVEHRQEEHDKAEKDVADAESHHAEAHGHAEQQAEGTPEHAEAHEKAKDAKEHHETAKEKHQKAKEHVEHAKEKHEHAKHHAHRAHENRAHVDNAHQHLVELETLVLALLAEAAKLTGQETHEHRKAEKQKHQSKIDDVRHHAGKVHEHVKKVDAEVVEPPPPDPYA